VSVPTSVAIANLGNLEMKKVLLGTTALLGVGTLAGGAMASDGIKLDVGGFFRTAYQVNIDDNDKADSNNSADLGHDHNVDGVFSDAEIHFKGEVTLDNGLTAGARVELEGETAGDQIDEAYIYFSGGFGEVRIGSDDDSLAAMCVTPPGGTTNFGATSPNMIAANQGGAVSAASGGVLSSNSVCAGVDARGDAQKIAYYTPNFGGFQLGISYTPSEGTERQTDGGGPHVGMPGQAPNESRHNLSAYATYSYEGDGWGLTAGGGGAWEGHVEDGNDASGGTRDAQDFYQTGLNLSFGGFKIGGAFEYYNDIGQLSSGDAGDAWVAAGGLSYNVDAWTVGLQYAHGDYDVSTSTDSKTSETWDRIALTGNYDMGPGISLDAELAYTWAGVGNTNGDEDAQAIDRYDGFEIGIGTAFTF
jgi:outer membrane protein OmpU